MAVTRGRNIVKVAIIGDAKPLGAATTAANGFLSSFGKQAALVGAGVAVALAAAGFAAFKVGQSFDEAYDTIRVGTGATGQVLEDLKDDFREVAKQVPSSFGDVGTAIAELNRRTGQTGRGLQELSVQMLNASRITETDLGANIAASTRLFGDWSIATDDQGESLDKIFRASQATGIGFTRLQELMVQFGAPLRALGLDFDTTAALFSRFEKEGLNIETMLPGLKFALGNFAKEGIDPSQGLQDAIEGISNGTLDLADAVQIFGKRAASDMFVAIREGRFEFDDLKDSIVNGSDSINAAAKDTEDFGEKWQKFKNNILIRLEPIATAVFNGVSKAMDKLPAIIDRIVAKGRGVVEFFQRNRPLAIALAAAIGGVLVTAIVAWTASLVAAAVAQIAALAPMIAIGAALGLLVAAVIYAYQEWGWFRTAVDAVRDFIVNKLVPAFQAIAAFITDTAVPAIKDLAGGFNDNVMPSVRAVASFIGNTLVPALAAIVGFVRDHLIPWVLAVARTWTEIQIKVGIAVAQIVGFILGIPGRIGSTVSTLWNGLKDGITAAKDWVGDRIDDVVGFATGLPGRMVGVFSGMFDGIKEAFRTAVNWIIDKWNDLEFGIPGFDPPGPGPSFGGITIGTPNIPRLHSGGIFRAPPGQREGFALLADGEEILTAGQARSRSGGNMTVNLPAGTDPAGTVRALERWRRRNGKK